LSGGQIAAHARTQVTFVRLSGTNMYSVRPWLFTSTAPSPTSFLVETWTLPEAFLFTAANDRPADAPPAVVGDKLSAALPPAVSMAKVTAAAHAIDVPATCLIVSPLARLAADAAALLTG
jgi:hypothetical protein